MLAEATKAVSDANVVAVLQKAAAATGSDFNYLLSTAMRESSLKPQAQSSTSSASGLFQFVEQTWLGLVKEYGAKHGLGGVAAQITQNAEGHYRTTNPADRQAILALRKDPQTAALMEGEFSQATRATLQSALGRDVCGGELYAAHFLGPGAACKLIRMASSTPGASAADAFPEAAGSNRSVFFHPNGTPKTVRDVYNWAIKQPSGALPAGAVPKAAEATASFVTNTPTNPADAEALLRISSAWAPSHGFFASDDTNSAGLLNPLLLTPGLMDVLSSLH